MIYFQNFGNGSVETRNFKFGMRIEYERHQRKNTKYVKGIGEGSRDLFLEFCDPSISLERLKRENSNLAYNILIIRGTKRKNAKLHQGRSGEIM